MFGSVSTINPHSSARKLIEILFESSDNNVQPGFVNPLQFPKLMFSETFGGFLDWIWTIKAGMQFDKTKPAPVNRCGLLKSGFCSESLRIWNHPHIYSQFLHYPHLKTVVSHSIIGQWSLLDGQSAISQVPNKPDFAKNKRSHKSLIWCQNNFFSEWIFPYSSLGILFF